MEATEPIWAGATRKRISGPRGVDSRTKTRVETGKEGEECRLGKSRKKATKARKPGGLFWTKEYTSPRPVGQVPEEGQTGAQWWEEGVEKPRNQKRKKTHGRGASPHQAKAAGQTGGEGQQKGGGGKAKYLLGLPGTWRRLGEKQNGKDPEQQKKSPA